LARRIPGAGDWMIRIPAVATDFDPAQHGNPPEFPNENKLKRNPPIFTFSRHQFGLRGYKLSFSEPSAVDQFFIF